MTLFKACHNDDCDWKCKPIKSNQADKFCRRCGHPIVHSCKRCGSPINIDRDELCSECKEEIKIIQQERKEKIESGIKAGVAIVPAAIGIAAKLLPDKSKFTKILKKANKVINK